jgi:hypothetical protein
MDETIKTWMWRGGLAAALLVMTSSVAMADDRADRAKLYYERGVASMNAKNYDDAYDNLQRACAIQNKALYRVAFCEAGVATKSPNGSREACRGLPAKGLEPALEKRALAAVGDMNKLHAADWARRAGERDAQHAVDLWNKAIALDPLPPYYAGLCVSYQALGQAADAASACNQAAALAKGTKDAGKYQAAAKRMAGAAALVPTAEQQALLDQVARKTVWPSMQTEGYLSKSDITNGIAKARTCLEAIDAARKGGAKPQHLVRTDFPLPGAVKLAPPGGGPRIEHAPLSSVEALCQEKLGALVAKDAVDKLVAAQRKIDLIATGKELDEADIALLTGPANDCATAVAHALGALKVPGSTVLKVNDKVTVTLATARAEVCDKLTGETARVKAAWQARIEAARRAKLEPFKAVMKGDKARIIEEEYFYENSAWTRGGAEITEPAEFKKASVWFKVMSHDGDDGKTLWTLRRYEFRGDKLRKTTEKTMKTRQGQEPPAKAYR